MADISDIKTFFEQVATHPAIGHVIGDETKSHFFGYQYNQLISESKNKINYPALGLSDRTNQSLNGSYQFDGTSIKAPLSINLLIVDQLMNGDIIGEEAIYENLRGVADDIVLWLSSYAMARLTRNYPFLDRVDLSNVPIVRVGPIGTAPLYGYMIKIALSGRFVNYDANPLNTILAD